MMDDEVTYKEWEQKPGEMGKWVERKAVVVANFVAAELSPRLLGRRVRSRVYNSKNKTARISADQRIYELTDVYAHRNGNIVVNHGHYYLKHDTELELLLDV